MSRVLLSLFRNGNHFLPERFGGQLCQSHTNCQSQGKQCSNRIALEIVTEFCYLQILFTIDLVRESNETLFGFSVESELSNVNDLRVYVMRVEG